jgi:hypothetical protein
VRAEAEQRVYEKLNQKMDAFLDLGNRIELTWPGACEISPDWASSFFISIMNTQSKYEFRCFPASYACRNSLSHKQRRLI